MILYGYACFLVNFITLINGFFISRFRLSTIILHRHKFYPTKFNAHKLSASFQLAIYYKMLKLIIEIIVYILTNRGKIEV